MATDRTPANRLLPAVLVSERRTLWEAESGYYDGGARLAAVEFEGRRAGLAIPDRVSDLAMCASGEQTDAIDVTCTRRGLPNRDGAGVLWAPRGGLPRGCDVSHVITGHRNVGISHTWIPRDTVTLPDGSVLRVADYNDGAGNQGPRVVRMDSDGTEHAAVQVHITAYNCYPCLLVIPILAGGYSVYCLSWRVLTSGDWQVRCDVSDDRGGTWTRIGDVLEVAVSSTTYVRIGRLKAAYLDGQVILLAAAELAVAPAASPSILLHWASQTGGGLYQLVEAWSGADISKMGASPDVCVQWGLFVVAWCGVGDAAVAPGTATTINTVCLSSAWSRIEEEASISVAASTASTAWETAFQWPALTDSITEDECAIWASDDGSVYVTTHTTQDPQDPQVRLWPIARAIDPDLNWTRTGPSPLWTGALWWWRGEGQEEPLSVSVTEWKGQAKPWHAYIDIGGGGAHYRGYETTLGGWSTVTHGHYDSSLSPSSQTSWARTYTGWIDPSSTWWAVTAGAIVVGAGAGYRDLTEAGAGGNLTDTLGSTSSRRLATWDIEPRAQTVYLMTADQSGASTYIAQVRVTAAGVCTLWDMTGGVQRGAGYTLAGRVQIKTEVNAATCRAWVALADQGEDCIWHEIGSGLLTAAAASGTWSQLYLPAGGRVYLYSVCVQDGTYVGDSMIPTIAKYALMPRSLSSSGIYAGREVVLSSSTGPACVGDSWKVDPTWDYPPDALDPWIEPSPSTTCRTEPIASFPANTDEVRISWRLDQQGLPLSDLWGFGLCRLNHPGASVYAYYGAAWHLVGTVPTDSYASVHAIGRRIARDVAGGGAANWSRGELDGAGCTVRGGLSDAGALIVQSPGGTTIAGVSNPLLIDIAADPPLLVGTVRLWPQDALMVWRPSHDLASSVVIIEAIAIRIPVPATATTDPCWPSSGHYELGKFPAGPLLVMGWQHEIRDTRTIRAPYEVARAEDGSGTSRQVAPRSLEVWDLRWEPVPDHQVADGLLPDYVLGDAGAPLAFRHDARSIAGIVGQHGARVPVAFVPLTPLPHQHETMWWGKQWLYGYISAEVSLDAESSTSGRGRTQRISGITCTEEP